MVAFLLISVVLLLNMLIGMMSSTLTRTTDDDADRQFLFSTLVVRYLLQRPSPAPLRLLTLPYDALRVTCRSRAPDTPEMAYSRLPEMRWNTKRSSRDEGRGEARDHHDSSVMGTSMSVKPIAPNRVRSRALSESMKTRTIQDRNADILRRRKRLTQLVRLRVDLDEYVEAYGTRHHAREDGSRLGGRRDRRREEWRQRVQRFEIAAAARQAAAALETADSASDARTIPVANEQAKRGCAVVEPHMAAPNAAKATPPQPTQTTRTTTMASYFASRTVATRQE